MTKTIFTKIAIAAAATMLTLTPALADRNDHRHGNRHHHAERSYDHGKNYGHYHGKRHAHGHRHHRHWMKRFYGWNYGYKPHRRWY